MAVFKEQQLKKERQRALSELLVAECRSDSYTLESVAAILQSGADIDFSNCRPLYFAAKRHKFDLVEFLIRNGARTDGIAKSFLASMCDFKGFDDTMEEAFFKTLDLVYNKEGNYMELFTPYINNMAVNGKHEKLQALMDRYYLTEAEVAKAVYIRIIFEIINCGFDLMLAFIERHHKWMDKNTLDLAVSTNEWQVLEHFVEVGFEDLPSETAVAQAIFKGNLETLYILKNIGYNFSNKPIVLNKAIEAARVGRLQGILFLLDNGVKWTTNLKGKSLLQIAIKEGGELVKLAAKYKEVKEG